MDKAHISAFSTARHLLIGEISHVTSALNINKGPQRTRTEETKFATLIQSLNRIDVSNPKALFLEPLEYLQPFLEVIRSEDTNGPITATALSAVLKFMKCGLLDLATNPARGIRAIVTAVTRCNFKASDPEQDEIVLYKILQVLCYCVTCPYGYLLTNKLVYELTHTCFKMNMQDHLSVLLRKAAEATLLEMVQCIFGGFYGRQPILENESSTEKKEKSVNLTVKLMQSLDMKETEKQLEESLKSEVQAELALPPTDIEELEAQISYATPRESPPTETQAESGSSQTPEVSTVEDIPVTPKEEVPQTETTPLEVLPKEDLPTEDNHNEQAKDESPQTVEPTSTDKAPEENGSEAAVVPTSVEPISEHTETIVQDQFENVESTATEPVEHTPRKRTSTMGADGGQKDQDNDSDKRALLGSPSGSRTNNGDQEDNQKPCNVTVLIKLLSFFCSLLNPSASSKFKGEHVRALGLSLIGCFAETQGNQITKNAKIYNFVQDDIFKALLQAYLGIKKGEVATLTTLLRILYYFFASISDDLKTQTEIFFIYSFLHLNDDKPTALTLEQKGIILSTIIQLLKEPSFATDLFINFDCDVTCTTNVFADLIEFFHQHCSIVPVDKNKPTAIVEESLLTKLSLDGLLTIIKSILDRIKTFDPLLEPQLTIDILKQQRYIKESFQLASKHFSAKKPNSCFEILQDRKLLPVPLDAVSLAAFIYNTPFLDKAELGKYLGLKEEFVFDVLSEYSKFFALGQYENFITSYRAYFESFRPFGESQCIERYIEKFLEHYLPRSEFSTMSMDDAFVMCYSIIMLNVDLHSPQLTEKPKMTFPQYYKQLDGIADQKLLQSIYNSVKTDEIKIHREHLTKTANFDNTWRHVLQQATNLGQKKFLISGEMAGYYDSLIFSNLWRKVTLSMKFLFSSTKDQDILDKTVECFRMCSEIAHHYKSSQPIDTIIVSFCELSSVQTLPLKKFGVQFGQKNKSQHALIQLFKTIRKHGDFILESWRNIFSCYTYLAQAGMIQVEDLIKWKDIFTFANENAAPPQQPQSGGFTSWVGSWFGISGAAADNEPLSEPQKKFHETAIKTIKKCKMERVIQDSPNLSGEAFFYFAQVLKSFCLLPLPTGDAPKEPTPTNAAISVSSIESAIFSIKVLTELALLNKSRITLIWAQFAEIPLPIGALLKNPANFQFIYTVAICSFTLARAFIPVEEIRSSILSMMAIFTRLELTQSFEHSKLRRKIATGIRIALTGNLKYFSEIDEWRTICTFIEWIHTQNCVADGLDILCLLVDPYVKKHQENARKSADNTKKVLKITTLCSSKNFSQVLELIKKFMANNGNPHKPDSPLADKLFRALYHIVVCFQKISYPSEKEAVDKVLLPTLLYMKEISCDLRSGVHQMALSTLQRALLCHEISLSANAWLVVLEHVIFPLLENFQLEAPIGVPTEVVNERRLKAIQGILCKTLLQHLTEFVSLPNFLQLWMKILSFLEWYIKKGDVLMVAVTEAIKNILMVMYTTEAFPETDPFWTETWKKINAFCPGLKTDFASTVAVKGEPEKK